MTPAASGFRATVEYYAKALVGSLVAGATAFQVANADNVVTTNEKIGVTIAFLTTLATIWGVTNGPEPVDFSEPPVGRWLRRTEGLRGPAPF